MVRIRRIQPPVHPFNARILVPTKSVTLRNGTSLFLIDAGTEDIMRIEFVFRAGIARPYYFFDVSEDRQTSLKIVPFQIMDATLYDYKKTDPDVSKDIILRLINETRKVGGLFVSIWHNTSLLENQEWTRWREVFEFMIKNQNT